jgi:type-F conjugative transfer system pilin assembly protein TrbC
MFEVKAAPVIENANTASSSDDIKKLTEKINAIDVKNIVKEKSKNTEKIDIDIKQDSSKFKNKEKDKDKDFIEMQEKIRLINAIDKRSMIESGLNTENDSPLFKNPDTVDIKTSQSEFMDLATGKKNLSQIAKKKYDLLIFVSFSMPAEILKEYSKQAKEYGAILVLRGLHKNSLQKTEEQAAEVNPTATEWDIAPATFRKFKIKQVPVIILADATNESVLEDGCAKEGDYLQVDGNVSIHHALALMSIYGNNEKMVKASEMFLESEKK